MGVTVGEADICDMAAMALILVARCLERREKSRPLVMSTITKIETEKKNTGIMSLIHAAQTYQILIVHHTVVDITMHTVIM